MAEEAQAAEAQEAQAAVQEETTDWKAKYEAMREHSREWERKAKGNQDAAEELEKLKAENQAEQEKAKNAEAALEEMRAKAEHAEAIARVADKANVPAEVVGMLNGKDEDELADQVKRLMKLLPVYPTRTDDGGSNAAVKASTAQQFADAIQFL